MQFVIEDTEAYKILARRAAEQEARYAAARTARSESAAPPTFEPPSAGLLAALRRAIAGGSAQRLPARAE